MAEEKKSKDEEKIVVDTQDAVEQLDQDLNDRINRLYGIASSKDEPKKEYDPKELEETRKKLIFLLMGVILGGIVILLIIINPFNIGKGNKTDTAVMPNEEQNINKDNNTIPIGEIDLSNSTVINLNSMVNFTMNDYMNIDLFPLYANEVLSSNNIPNDIKLYLLKRTGNFNQLLIEQNIEEYIKTCSADGLVIDKSKFDNLLGNIFGANVTIEYKDINYTYYSNFLAEKKLTLSYINDQYIVKCNDYKSNTTFNRLTQHKLIKAIKLDDAIEIYQKVVFITEKGVFKEPQLTTLITNNKEATLEEYINSGNTYKYTFMQNGDNFYLSKIEIVKED